MLAELGYAQYEISNFSRQGSECLHNINTWRMAEWLGLGPSAASQFKGERYRNSANLNKWLDGVKSGQPIKEELVELDATLLMIDAIIFGLRMNVGINLEEIEERFKLPELMKQLELLFERLSEENLLVWRDANIFLTQQGRLVCDAISNAILNHAEFNNS